MRVVAHALAELRAHPGRTLLSAFSLWIGVLAVVGIFAVAQVVDETFVAVSEQASGRELTVRGQIASPQLTVAAIRAAMAQADGLAQTGGGYAMLGEPRGPTGVAVHNGEAPGRPLMAQQMLFVAGDLSRVRRLPTLAGRWFNTNADLPIEVVANLPAARRWGGVGTVLDVAPTTDQPPVPAPVVGVIADGSNEPILLLPLIAVLNARPTALSNQPVDVLLHHPNAPVGTLQDIGQRMALASGARLTGPVDRADAADRLRAQLRSQQTAFLAVAVAALFIAAVGMLNIGLASVAERARELVIRRAVGASRADILWQMLLAAVFAGVLAAALAMMAAWGVLEWWVPQRIDPSTAIQPPTFPWTAAIWGLVASIGTTLLGAAVPALVAARLDVATALRD